MEMWEAVECNRKFSEAGLSFILVEEGRGYYVQKKDIKKIT